MNITDFEMLILAVEKLGKRLENITEELIKIEEAIRDTAGV